MAKIYTVIGFATLKETKPGVWKEVIDEHGYFGELYKSSRRLENSSGVNDNVIFSNEISILSDPFAFENYTKMRYVSYLGNKWKVSNVDIQYPRLLLTTGGLYND